MKLLGLAVIGLIGYTGYRLLRDDDDCSIKQSSLNEWANSFEPPLGVLYLFTLDGSPPSRSEFIELPSFPGNFVVINSQKDFYVYPTNQDVAVLSPNLKEDYCQRFGRWHSRR
jgi:hypothetical protein